MNQHVRISDLVIDGEAAEPSAKFRVAFAKAGAFACKFIIGEPDEKAICCGAPTDGKSWCAYHRRIVFEKRVH
jgi:hypothetical protein